MEHNFWKSKNWLISGVTSGLGKALALEALKAGGRVAGVARTGRGLEVFSDWRRQFHFIKGDISKKETIHAIAAEAAAHLGAVDVLINNASTLGPVPLRPLLDLECEEFSEVLETNLLGPFRLTKLVLPSMVLRESGIVVNISSDAAVESYSNWGAYGSSKAALDHLTRIWQAEVPSVEFYAFDPGEMNTPMHQAAIPDADVSKLRDPAETAAKILRAIGPGRVTEGTSLRRAV